MALQSLFLILLAGAAQLAQAHPKIFEQSRANAVETFDDAFPGDGETQADSVFSGIATFGRLPYWKCLNDKSQSFDIAFLGAPFDTGTSYRPGARFGPSGIREGSRRLNLYGGYNVPMETNPFNNWAKIVDCGDIPLTSYDNAVAIKQIENGHFELLTRKPTSYSEKDGYALDGSVLPRVITLGGDHTIVLPILRSVSRAYGPVSIIHFDSHLDSWKPKVFGGGKSSVGSINHGTYFYHASQEGLVSNDSNIHAGIRTTLSGLSDYDNDADCGFEIIEAREIDTIGIDAIIKRIRDRVGDGIAYLSIDIDVLDPAYAPATGTPESAGWTTRELRTILRGLDGIKLVGADIVEVAPAYDFAEVTTLAAADILFEVMSIMVKTPVYKEQAKQQSRFY
ncbi:Agmatinase [Schizosaccharomyces pombe]|uniref:Putative agmatinase 1 n=1 Tax=Schizosaccharomyces pombe (strain 972 / ATCC 24843) TaxID=284812 RepID=SPEB1_SCHPO|nr:putative agmatinase [Schizosaccharomyces pombe]Q10088.1 RecName: Full=Putative agmatinase 1; AltName: Full=Agmatine ureohydrolase 1; Short=AUH 1; Flags: Precursor [Schizosaccharomyces pombe 972h-]CAA92310.1 agmatinase (predicted) [Schizosaccharomyces pombe]|eukprot:NP_592806.1 putative agmatinase [Schizosaccharomyces pombe]